MGKKLTIEEVKLQAKKFGNWIVLDDYYKGPHAKLNCRCAKCGYIHKLLWRQIRSCGCIECNRKSKFLSIEYIKKEAFKKGWLVSSDNYEGKFTKLDCQCIKCGHKTQFVWQSIRKNVRCEKCNKISKLEFIRVEFAKEGYELLSTVYEGNHLKLEYVCPIGHRHCIAWSVWNSKKRHRCPYCVGTAKLNIEFIRAEFAKEGYILLTEVYENNKQKLEYICSGPEKHKHSIRWDNWKSGGRCPECSTIRRAADSRTDIEFIRAEFAKEGYILLTEIYENNAQKLEYKCPMGHYHSVTWGHWSSKEKRRCPFCNSVGVSKWEKTIRKFLSESNIDYVGNDKTQLLNPETNYNLELDIWFPDLNKAIECNGIYWHSKKRAIKNDKIKQQLCKDQGIDLLVITDEEWKDDTDKCKAKLISFVKGEIKTCHIIE